MNHMKSLKKIHCTIVHNYITWSGSSI